MNRGRPSRRPGNGMLYFAAIHAASQFLHLPRMPPVTAALIVANTLIYLRPGRLNETLPYWQDVCLQPYLVIQGKDLRRLLLSAFYHVDDVHLVFNMTSLMWKGVHLEGRYGSRQFAIMVGTLLGLSHGLVVLSAKLLSVVADIHGPMHQCAVGFSAVLFAFKVVLNYNSATYTTVYGILVPSRYAALAEVFLVQLLVPGSSFLGHVCGILAGLIYVHAADVLRPGFPSSNRLRRLAALPLAILTWPFRWISWPFRGPSSGYVGSRRTRTQLPSPPAAWRCLTCTYDNTVSQGMCEMCETPRVTGAHDIDMRVSAGGSPSAPLWPESGSLSIEEMRNARVARFSRQHAR